MPSVRGRARIIVISTFLASGTAAAAAAGLVAGMLGALAGEAIGFGRPGTTTVVAMVLLGLGLDGLAATNRRFRPPSIGRQVPQEWGRLFPTAVVAALYGGRLGIGPLTILSTWGWWMATVIGAALGLVPAVLVGATFGVVRLVVTVGVSLVVSESGRPQAFELLQRARRPGRLALHGLGLLAVVTLSVGGCARPGTGADEARGPLRHLPLLDGADLTSSTATATPPASGSDGSAAGAPPFGSSRPPATAPWSPIAGAPGRPGGTPAGPHSIVTVPAQLEDFVRPVQADTALPVEISYPTPAPVELAGALLSTVAGFEPIDEDATDRHLDMAAASALQPDPTEEVALLETRGFQGGWTRAFRSIANDVAVMSVYHFEDAAQAEFYLEDGLITIGGYGGRFFDIEGLPGIRGFTQSFVDDGEPVMTLGAAFQVGPRWYLVYLVGAPERVGPDVLVPMIVELQESASARSTSSE